MLAFLWMMQGRPGDAGASITNETMTFCPDPSTMLSLWRQAQLPGSAPGMSLTAEGAVGNGLKTGCHDTKVRAVSGRAHHTAVLFPPLAGMKHNRERGVSSLSVISS